MSNDPVREWILSEGKATEITRISSIGGGCINLANRYDTDAGSFFVKTNRYYWMCCGDLVHRQSCVLFPIFYGGQKSATLA